VTSFYKKLVELLEAGERVAVASILSTSGSTPRKAGARMMVLADGRTFFTVGGGSFEAEVVEEALRALRSGGGGVRRWDFTSGGENPTGMTCGGNAEVLLELIEPEARLLVFGGGHVGRALARLARGIGFLATIVDDREEYTDPSRLPEGVQGLRLALRGEWEPPPLDGRTFALVATRDHALDRDVLGRLADSSPAYLGMLGSKRKWSLIRETLEGRGIESAWLDRVRVPAGLDLGGETPEEIALEILAEMVQVRNRLPEEQGEG
jgi:xanthine dehydrogenase accessory factor